MAHVPSPSSVRSVGWEEEKGRRDEMEDGWVFVDHFDESPSSCFWGVYDGHGGRSCMEYVMENLHVNLLAELEQDVANVPDCMMRAFEVTDSDMQTAGLTSSGCTACCCLLRQEKGFADRVLYTAHIGDARAVLCRKGLAVRLTGSSDHKATYSEEARRVVEAGGTIYNERVNGMLAISRAFGDFQLKAPAFPNDIVSNVPEVSSTLISDGDIFVITACDGLWDVIDDQDAANLVIEGMQQFTTLMIGEPGHEKSLGQMAARILIEEALARGTSDNVTCLVVFP